MVAARPVARWSLLSKLASKARSSHCVSVTDSGLCLIYGGELKPRIPVDSESFTLTADESKLPAKGDGPAVRGCVHALDLSSHLKSLEEQSTNQGKGNGWVVLPPSFTSSVPLPRVGATAVWSTKDRKFYMWGGRGGVDMAPVGPGEVGMWKGSLLTAAAGDSTKLAAISWEQVPAVNKGDAPESRSYHAAVSHGSKIYIHAGCPETGRLSTLHSFDVDTLAWRTLATAPEPGRGGPGLAFASLTQEGDVLLRFGGFAGYELPTDNSLDIYTITSNTWRSVVPAPDPEHGYPGPRSVHGFVDFHSSSSKFSNAVAVLYHGEGEASNLGHAGAGRFYDDVWLLLQSKNDNGGLEWRKAETIGGLKPEGRGWFPPAMWIYPKGESKIVLFGGLLSSNERSDETWLLEIK